MQKNLCLISSGDDIAQSSLATPLAIALRIFHYTEKSRGEWELILGFSDRVKKAIATKSILNFVACSSRKFQTICCEVM